MNGVIVPNVNLIGDGGVRRGTPSLFIPWAHHLWEDLLGLGAKPHGWQQRSGVSTDQTRAADAGSGDVERQLTVGKGTGACEGGGVQLDLI